MKWMIAILATALVISLAAWKLCFPVDDGFSAIFPDLETQWSAQVYDLDDDEVLRLIARPFPPSGGMIFGADTSAGQAFYFVENGEGARRTGWNSKPGTVYSAVNACTTMPEYELRINSEVASISVDGDWVVRNQAPLERRVHALNSLLVAASGRALEMMKDTADCYVVVVSGNWTLDGKAHKPFEPLRFVDHPKCDISGSESQQGGTEDFLRVLETNCRCKFIDETANPRPKSVSWIHDNPPPVWDALERQGIFQVIESQSSLKFFETRRKVMLWHVRIRPLDQK